MATRQGGNTRPAAGSGKVCQFKLVLLGALSVVCNDDSSGKVYLTVGADGLDCVTVYR